MEHIPRAQPRSCLYALSQCFIQLPVPDTRSILQEKKSSAVVVISTARGYTINLAGKAELCCYSDFAAIVCILFIAYS